MTIEKYSHQNLSAVSSHVRLETRSLLSEIDKSAIMMAADIIGADMLFLLKVCDHNDDDIAPDTSAI